MGLIRLAMAAAAAAVAAGASVRAGAAAKAQWHGKVDGAVASLRAGGHDSLALMLESAGRGLLNARDTKGWATLPSAPSGNTTDAKWCPNSSWFQFFPARVSRPSQHAPVSTSSNDGCFATTTATAAFTTGGASVTLTGASPSSLLCSDTYLVSTLYSLQVVEISALSPAKTVSFTFTNPNEGTEAAINGFSVYLLPCGLLGTVSSALDTINLFINPNETAIETANAAFLSARGDWPNPLKAFNQLTAVPKASVPSGTYLAITKLDGLDPLIAFGTSGATGHSALAVWQTDANGNRDLFVMESTDANPFGHVYWPPPYGIRLTQWDEWVSLAQAARYHVGLMALAPTYAAAFDESAFWSWFYTVQGLPYGYHTMLWSFLDNADKNLPQPVVLDFFGVLFNYLDPLLPNTSNVNVNVMITQGMNKRLGTNCNAFSCVLDALVANLVAGKTPNSVGAATSIPDDDSWTFGGNYSMVCSEFAAKGWKVASKAKLPIWNAIIAAEQTPKDNYQMGMFDGNYWTQANCPGGVTTAPGSQGNYCQLMGPYQLSLAGYNSIPLYAGMNNACAAQWPTMVRCPDGSNNCQC